MKYTRDDWTPPPEPTEGLPLWIVDRPLPYAKGSDTSREAAEEQYVAAMRDRRVVLACFREHGPMTADECAAKLGQSVLAIRPRCSELVANGFLIKTDEKRKNSSGLSARVLRSVK